LKGPIIRVLVVDDYKPWRRIVRLALQMHARLQVVSEASDGLEAVELAKQLQPDLMLLDLGLPTMNGIEVARAITKLCPDLKILFLSENRSRDLAIEALRTGALGYVVKSDAARELLPAVEAVLQGRQFVSASLEGNEFSDFKDVQTDNPHVRNKVVTFIPPPQAETTLPRGNGVAAAADLQFALQEVAAQFQKESGKEVKVIYGSSGNFFQRLQNGAPFDMFFSANLDYPKKLQTAGLTEPGSYYEYAKGKIVVWVPKDSALDLSSGLRVLLNPLIKKIAIANPRHAPYGQAAVAAMQTEGIYDRVKAKCVLGENISQAASFVLSGAADVGIVALSLALSPNMKDKGRYAEIPAADYPPIEQACVILKSSKNKETAKQFLWFVKTAAIAETLRRYGFDVQAAER